MSTNIHVTTKLILWEGLSILSGKARLEAVVKFKDPYKRFKKKVTIKVPIEYAPKDEITHRFLDTVERLTTTESGEKTMINWIKEEVLKYFSERYYSDGISSRLSNTHKILSNKTIDITVEVNK